ncbi:hypothetical protein BCR33DRAFT_716895, partial [Rhizoclosmatium globosum]
TDFFDIYKAVTSFDPNAQAGILPSGNLGFQHFIDTLKICLMVFNQSTTNNTEAKDLIGRSISRTRSMSVKRPTKSSMTPQISERQIKPEYVVQIEGVTKI